MEGPLIKSKFSKTLQGNIKEINLQIKNSEKLEEELKNIKEIAENIEGDIQDIQNFYF